MDGAAVQAARWPARLQEEAGEGQEEAGEGSARRSRG